MNQSTSHYMTLTITYCDLLEFLCRYGLEMKESCQQILKTKKTSIQGYID